MNRIEERLLVEKYCLKCRYSGRRTNDSFDYRKKCLDVQCKNSILTTNDWNWVVFDPQYPKQQGIITFCKGEYFEEKI